MMKRRMYRNNNTGSTMVETLVSFVVLFVVLAALYGIVSFSSELYMKSVDTSRVNQRFYREIYKYPLGKVADQVDDSYIKTSSYDPGFSSSEEDNGKYAGLTLILDIEKTSQDNGINNGIRDTYINLDNVGVTSFTCNDTEAKEKELILPKALHFWWIDPDDAGN